MPCFFTGGSSRPPKKVWRYPGVPIPYRLQIKYKEA